jgi:pimeloyl-ACP methyl ester carboxylesterase
MWDGVVPALHGEGHEVVAPDLRGFGSRPPGPAPFSHAGDVLALLDGLGAERADLVGASFGGLVALEVAALAPERVRSLALLAPLLLAWEWSEHFRSYVRAEDAALARGDVDAAVELNVRYWAGDADPRVQDYVAAAQRRAFELGDGGAEAEELDPPVSERLGDVAAPALVMVGDGDVPDFVAIARHLAGTLPRAELRVVEGAGHLLALERPAEVGAALAAWLRAGGR